MFFGKITIENSLGNILAHTINVGDKKFSKGKVILKKDITHFKNNGFYSIICAVPDKKDIHENKIAKLIAKCFINKCTIMEESFTGRVNIITNQSGLLIIDQKLINKFNAISEQTTIATLSNYSKVNKGDILATIKIIPFYVKESIFQRINAIKLNKVLFIHPFNHKKVGLLLTHDIKENSKLNAISIKRIAARLDALNSKLYKVCTCQHGSSEISKNIKVMTKEKIDIILILGASAIVDIHDKIPEAIKLCKGKIIRFGMPVDPGNLLLLGKIKNTPVIGLPGCARSPNINGFDWILERLIADNKITNNHISDMGVGGLLKTQNKNIKKKFNISNIILAAGQSKRMKRNNKLLMNYKDQSILKHVITAASKSKANNTIIVLGYQNELIEQNINDLNIIVATNSTYKKGLSSSLKTGISALPEDCDAAIIMLADMPKIKPEVINNLIDNYDPSNNKWIVAPSYKGKRGNPILISRKFFPDILNLKGDIGAKNILDKNTNNICVIPQRDSSILIDIDTKNDYEKLS